MFSPSCLVIFLIATNMLKISTEAPESIVYKHLMRFPEGDMDHASRSVITLRVDVL